MPLLPWTSKTPEFLHAVKALQTTTPRALVNGVTVFRVSGGPVIIQSLVSRAATACDTTASTLQWNSTPDLGSATTFTGASASLASFAAGGLIVCNMTALSTAPVITGTTGVALQGTPGVIVPEGLITTVVGVGSTTGTFIHFLRYSPLTPSSLVTVA